MKRREFLFTSGAALAEMLSGAVQTAASIDPPANSTYLDAEHIVVLMQENRSFDHAFGTLRGVRGFNDPRAVTLPNQNPVWQQSNAAGETHTPFRLNLKDTKATWLGSLPHGWRDQTDARNHGNHDRWLDAKPSSRKECAGMPLTMGYYNRDDLPFYYALADAFTVCDQNFCSSLTGTTPNRLHLWTGTIREKPNAPANVRNSEVDYGAPARWTTFPERLEDAGVSWRVYQNEVSVPSGLKGEEDDWLANFTDNPLEWFQQYHIGFSENYRKYLKQLPPELAALDRPLAKAALQPDTQAQLSPRERSLHERAFTTNKGDAAYRQLTTLTYNDAGTARTLQVPKGDPLYQFRRDVQGGKLPAVSWLVPSANFSDHPGSPWYGAWYLAEVMNILTRNPQVWKKTIFILTYDENDGYFDHVPPFVAPDPRNAETGKVSAGINAASEYVTLEEDLKKQPAREARGGPIGLGYRVPMIVASPWSRGGYVNSQVFDHTSVIQLMEKLLSHRTGKKIQETNLSNWRRAVCGDLTSTFRPFHSSPAAPLPHPPMNDVLEGIHRAQFKPLPTGFNRSDTWTPEQESGVRPANALPYELHAEALVNASAIQLTLSSRGAAGAPFHVYTPGQFRGKTELRTRAYTVGAGQRLKDTWALEGFANAHYHLRVLGPNGYFCEFAGSATDPLLEVSCRYHSGDFELLVKNRHPRQSYTLQMADQGYGTRVQPIAVNAGSEKSVRLLLGRSAHWYDVSLTLDGYVRRFAGRVETGQPGTSDPLMGRVPLS